MTGQSSFAASTPEHPPGDHDERVPRGVWLLLGAIATAKIATLLIVFALAWSGEAQLWAAITTWYWLPVAAALLAGPVLFRLRLRRVRAKRETLRRAEWMVTEAPSGDESRSDRAAMS